MIFSVESNEMSVHKGSMGRSKKRLSQLQFGDLITLLGLIKRAWVLQNYTLENATQSVGDSEKGHH